MEGSKKAISEEGTGIEVAGSLLQYGGSFTTYLQTPWHVLPIHMLHLNTHWRPDCNTETDHTLLTLYLSNASHSHSLLGWTVRNTRPLEEEACNNSDSVSSCEVVDTRTSL